MHVRCRSEKGESARTFGSLTAGAARPIIGGKMPDPEFPDVFTDSANVAVGEYGVCLTFFLTDPLSQGPKDRPGRTVARLRMAPALASAVAEILTQRLAQSPKVAMSEPTKDQA
jgi:hypothetical protein